jgi:hypothetical protein
VTVRSRRRSLALTLTVLAAGALLSIGSLRCIGPAVGTTTTPNDAVSERADGGQAGSTRARSRFCGESGVSVSGERCRITVDDTDAIAGADGAPPLLPTSAPATLSRSSIADAADPSVLVDGQTYFMFSTSVAYINIPVAIIPAAALRARDVAPGFDIVGGSELIAPSGTVRRTEAMPVAPAWADRSGLWAPTVAQFGQRYVMFFAAKRPSPPDPINAECIGRAVADRPEGPYVPEPTPFTCGVNDVHGALDPSVFRSPDGGVYLHVAFGGTPTMLWTIPLTPDAGAAGDPVPLLRIQQPWESWFLENPSMVYDGTHFVLAYSVGDWKLPTYATGLARCSTPTGPCRSSPSGPWLASTGEVTGPGGLAFFTDVNGRLLAAFHGYAKGNEAIYGARSTFFRRVDLSTQGIALD